MEGLEAKKKANPQDLNTLTALRTEQLKASGFLSPKGDLKEENQGENEEEEGSEGIPFIQLNLKGARSPFFFMLFNQTQNRLIEGELTAEEIVRDKTVATFKGKCRILFDHAKPSH